MGKIEIQLNLVILCIYLKVFYWQIVVDFIILIKMFNFRTMVKQTLVWLFMMKYMKAKGCEM